MNKSKSVTMLRVGGSGADSEQEAPEPKREKTIVQARSYAVWILAKGMVTAGMLSDKILAKGYSKKDVASVVAEMQRMGYVNDAEYANVFFRNMLDFKQYGYYGVKMRLQRKKIAETEITRVMKGFTESKEKIVAKRFVSLHANESPEKLVRMLQNRGFRWPAISAATVFSPSTTEE